MYFTNKMDHCINNINKKLGEIFGDQLNTFKTYLQESGAVISGSFIVQCILDEYWTDSDCDVFVPVKGLILDQTTYRNPITEIEKFMCSLRYPMVEYDNANQYGHVLNREDIAIQWVRTYGTCSNNIMASVDYMTCCEHEKMDTLINEMKWRWKYVYKRRKYDTLNRIENAYVHRLGPAMAKIQFIQVKIEKDHQKMFDYIKKSFDFDICKNVYYIDAQGHETVKVFAIQQIQSRILHIDPLRTDPCYLTHADFNYEEYEKHRCERAAKRLEKYKRRGFIPKTDLTKFMCIKDALGQMLLDDLYPQIVQFTGVLH